MSIDDQNRVIGQRPLRKILMGDDAPRYLHIAQNKLQNMYRSNTSTEIVQVTQVDNARITVGKHTSHDVIKIEVEGYTWVAVATVGDFFYGTSPGYTQFAKAPKQTGKWSEKVIDSLATNPPIDDLGYAMPNGYLPLSSPYLCPTGDQGGWAFADAVGPTFITADGRVNPSAFTQLRNNYDAN